MNINQMLYYTGDESKEYVRIFFDEKLKVRSVNQKIKTKNSTDQAVLFNCTMY